jgi:hypothetical protein
MEALKGSKIFLLSGLQPQQMTCCHASISEPLILFFWSYIRIAF